MRTKSAGAVKKQLFLLVIVLAAMIALLPVEAMAEVNGQARASDINHKIYVNGIAVDPGADQQISCGGGVSRL